MLSLTESHHLGSHSRPADSELCMATAHFSMGISLGYRNAYTDSVGSSHENKHH